MTYADTCPMLLGVDGDGRQPTPNPAPSAAQIGAKTMINPTFNLSTVTDFARITTATICTERVTLLPAPDDVRAEFMGFISDAVWNAGWSLAGLKGKAREYKGSYYRTLQRNLVKYLATTGREVGFAYDATKGGTKRPWTRIDGSPMWLD